MNLLDNKCPYWDKCRNYNEVNDICYSNEGFYGTIFKADSCFKEKEECPE